MVKLQNPDQPPSRWQRLLAWIQTHRPQVLAGVGLFLIIIAATISYIIVSRPLPQATVIAPPPPKPIEKFYSPLTGLEVRDEAATKQLVTAVMIENSPDARPQSGLKEAGTVFEAVAEGGITRFAALYQEAKPALIGPVRSLRPYYLDWIAAYDASIAHVGGSPEALAEVRNGKYRDIDQFFNDSAYWRSTDRYAPHNVYTNFKRLDALNKAKGYTTSKFTGFERQAGKPSSEPTASSITIKLSSALYNTAYSFDATTNTYKRKLAGNPHKDREKGQITPNAVIALKVNQASGFYRNITTIGSGDAIVFQNGTATKATWRKTSKRTPLTVEDADGKAIKLNRGQTWIAAVSNTHGSVTWK